jgi:hypothetical protein
VNGVIKKVTLNRINTTNHIPHSVEDMIVEYVEERKLIHKGRNITVTTFSLSIPTVPS